MRVKSLINTTYKNFDFKQGKTFEVSFTREELLSHEKQLINPYISKVFEIEEVETIEEVVETPKQEPKAVNKKRK